MIIQSFLSLTTAIAALLTIVTTSSGVNAAVQFSGLNEAGLEFGMTINGPSPGTVPGALNQQFFAPNLAAVQHAVQSIGANMFRLPIMWERMQPTPMGPLDAGYLNTVMTAISQIKATGAIAVLDVHNYARYNSQITTGAALGDLWTKIAQIYGNDNKVWFGMMNEPHNIDTVQWFTIAQGALTAIRAAGATNVVTVPGNCFTGAHNWVTGACDTGIPNAQAALAIKDPMNNMIFEMHQYLDVDFSGTHADCTQSGAQVLVDATNWLRTNGKKGYIGEAGIGNNANCATEFGNMLAFMDANSDVWVGYSYWAAGSAWGQYILSVESSSTAMDAMFAQIPVLAAHKGTGVAGGGGAASSPPATTATTPTTTTTTTTMPPMTTTMMPTTVLPPPPVTTTQPPVVTTPPPTGAPVTVVVTVTSTILTTVTISAAGGPAPTTPPTTPPPANNGGNNGGNLNAPTVTHTVAAGLTGGGWCAGGQFTTQLGATVKSVQASIQGTQCGNQPMGECGLATITGSVTANGAPVNIVSYGGAGSAVSGNTFTFTEKDDMPYYGGTLTLAIPCDYAANSPATIGQTVKVTFAAQTTSTMLTLANGNQVPANIVVVSA